jgi:hypothetical protein
MRSVHRVGNRRTDEPIEYEYRPLQRIEYKVRWDPDRLWARTFVVTDVAGDHDSKSQESTGGDFGAPHCSLFEQPSGFEQEVQDRYRVA